MVCIVPMPALLANRYVHAALLLPVLRLVLVFVFVLEPTAFAVVLNAFVCDCFVCVTKWKRFILINFQNKQQRRFNGAVIIR